MNLKSLVCVNLIALIASLSPAAHTQTFSVIHTFTDQYGVFPSAGVTARAGVLYGTTSCTRPFPCGNGTVYLMSGGDSNWTYSLISRFSASGVSPETGVVFGPDNHLYGTTTQGGSENAGTVFSLGAAATVCKTAACGWVEDVLYSFQGTPDGELPCCEDLVWDSTGNIYGTTNAGGRSSLGTVFQMKESGSNWTETPIYSFAGPDGANPFGGVILDGDGNLFGTTTWGGSYGMYGYGTVFELTYIDGVGWTESVLYSFQDLSDGENPEAGLVRDSAGNFYGASSRQGGSQGGGTIFKLSPVGDSWIFTPIYSYDLSDCAPVITLTMDGSGNLYGTTTCGGASRMGSVFKLTNTQNGWTYTSVHDFSGGADGATPVSNVTIDTDGTLYGTAFYGGSPSCNPPSGCGTVWMIKP
jgi:uncharacterized repeat protein (TIGR03803 family)